MAYIGVFKTQILALAGNLVTEDDAAMERWLVDGCHNVMNKSLKSEGPSNIWKFASRVAGATNSTPFPIDTSRKIISVESTTSDGTTMAKEGNPMLSRKYRDNKSIYFATDDNPVWWIEDHTLVMAPHPGASGSTIWSIPEWSITQWDSANSSVTDFPEEYYEAIVLYAAIQVIHRRMLDMNNDIPVLEVTAVAPATPTIATVSYSAVTPTEMAEVSTMVVGDIVHTSDATAGSTAGGSSSQPIFTPPGVPVPPSIVSELTLMKALVDTEEDPEMSKAKAEEIQTILLQFQNSTASFGQELENAKGNFEEYNAEYQAKVKDAETNANLENSTNLANMQKDAQEATSNYQKAMEIAKTSNQSELQKKQLDAQNAHAALMQDAVQTTQAIIQDNQAKMGQWSQELTQYQALVSAETNTYTQNLNKYAKDYEWLMGAYQRLKMDYEAQFQPPGGPPPPPPRR